MATIIDITGKIKNEQKFICYNGKNYKVDDRKNTVLETLAVLDNSSMAEAIDTVLAKLLGKDAVKDFEDLTYEDCLVPFFAAMAAVQGKSYEEVEASFRKHSEN